MSSPPEGNPFSTRCVRPGSLEFQFPDALHPRQLVERLASQRWWGQIVGVHGVGKSTLLHTWVPWLADAGRVISWWTLQGGQRRLPAELWRDARLWHAATLVVVDGYEQLSWFARRRLIARCRRTRAGLLITTHRDVGLPTLVTLSCPLDTVQRLVAQRLPADSRVIDPAEVSTCYHAHDGNVREVFFALYDLYEQRRHQFPKASDIPG
ncbi:MAG: hypothetical protein ACYC3X_09450 [Pirellulaceae bacterium]